MLSDIFARQVAQRVASVVFAIRKLLPSSTIALHPILPFAYPAVSLSGMTLGYPNYDCPDVCAPLPYRIAFEANQYLRALFTGSSAGSNVNIVECEKLFLNSTGAIVKGYFIGDLLHPRMEGMASDLP